MSIQLRWVLALKIMLWVFVFSLGVANCLMTVNTVAEIMNEPGLVYDHGVRAAVFAIVAASALFIVLLGRDEAPRTAFIDSVCRLTSVVTAFLAGVFWLLDETEGKTGFFILTLLATAGVLTTGLVVMLVIQALSQWIQALSQWKRRRSHP